MRTSKFFLRHGAKISTKLLVLFLGAWLLHVYWGELNRKSLEAFGFGGAMAFVCATTCLGISLKVICKT